MIIEDQNAFLTASFNNLIIAYDLQTQPQKIVF